LRDAGGSVSRARREHPVEHAARSRVPRTGDRPHGRARRSAYELNQHDAIAREVGVSQERLDALREGPDSPVFTAQERALVQFTDEVALAAKASDHSFAEVAAFLDPCEIQELILAIGYYSMVGRFLETLEVDLEEGDQVDFVRLGNLRGVRPGSSSWDSI
jgi:hypothetical protein